MAVPVFIISYNRLAWLEAMLPQIARLGGEPIVVDHASTYPPLLAWYETAPCLVLRTGANAGPQSLWPRGVLAGCEEPFVVTDPDLDLSGVPDDALARMREALGRHPDVDKIGLSLRLDDLPEGSPLTPIARERERHYWYNLLEDGLYSAYVDTTFALYRPEARHTFRYDACRMPPPYTARHLPWYLDPARPNDEDLFYLEAAQPAYSTTLGLLRENLPEGLRGPLAR